MVGNGTTVSSPTWPDNVFNVRNSSYLHYDIGNSSPNNAFSNLLFIANRIPNDTQNKSKVYICDMNFMYPSESIQVEEDMVVGGGSTNTFN